MRKVIVSILMTAALLVGLSSVRVQAGCQDINLTNRMGSFVGTVCIDRTTSTITLDGTATVAATGNTYIVDADAMVSGTPGNYTVAGTVTISEPDGTVLKTVTFSCSGMNPVMSQTAFVGKAIGLALSQTAPAPVRPRDTTTTDAD